jgi:hypothetical protein
MLKLSLAVAACAMSASVLAAAPSIEPGLYEVTTQLEGSAPQTSQKCLTAAELAKGLQPSGMAKECRITRNALADGKIDLAAACPDMSMTVAGSYTSNTYKADTKMTGTVGGKSFDVASHIAAKKVAATCKE